MLPVEKFAFAFHFQPSTASVRYRSMAIQPAAEPDQSPFKSPEDTPEPAPDPDESRPIELDPLDPDVPVPGGGLMNSPAKPRRG